MTKQKEKNSSEHLKSIIRKQKSIIKKLTKDANRSNKIKQQFEEYEVAEMIEEELAVKSLKNDDRCPECFKGEVEVVNLGPRKMLICSNCNFRKIKK